MIINIIFQAQQYLILCEQNIQAPATYTKKNIIIIIMIFLYILLELSVE